MEAWERHKLALRNPQSRRKTNYYNAPWEKAGPVLMQGAWDLRARSNSFACLVRKELTEKPYLPLYYRRRDRVDSYCLFQPVFRFYKRRERHTLDQAWVFFKGSEQRLETSYTSLRPQRVPMNICWVLKNVRLRYDLEIMSGHLRIALQPENGRSFYYESCISQKPLIPWNLPWGFSEALTSSFKGPRFWSCLPRRSSKENWAEPFTRKIWLGFISSIPLLLLLSMGWLGVVISNKI